MKPDWRGVTRYGFVSGLTWAIDFGVFAISHDHIGYVGAMVAARCVALVFSFPAHRWFSFDASGPTNTREVTLYLALWLVNLAAATGLLALLAGIGLGYPLALKLIVEIVVFLVNFLILKRLFAKAAPRD